MKEQGNILRSLQAACHLVAKYDAPKEQITKDVASVLVKLRGIGAVEE